MNKLTLALGLVVVAVLLVLAFWLGQHRGEATVSRLKDDEFAAVLERLAEEHEHVAVEKNRQVASLQEALAGKDVAIAVQAGLIQQLKDRPADVRYITRVETVLAPAETVTAPVADLPVEHLFVAGPLTVARFSHDGDDATFETFEQRFVLDAALGETSSAFLLRAATSYDDELHEIPVDIQVTHVVSQPPRTLQARLALGVTVGGGAQGSTSPGIVLGASLTLPWLHPLPRLDVATPRATVASSMLLDGTSRVAFRGGVDVVSFNLGKEGAFVSDLWAGLGPSFGTDGMWSIDLTLSTRL